MSGSDDSFVADIMKKLGTEGVYEVPEDIKNKIKAVFCAGCCGDEETMKAIKATRDEFGYVIDTHTAVAKAVYALLAASTFC